MQSVSMTQSLSESKGRAVVPPVCLPGTSPRPASRALRMAPTFQKGVPPSCERRGCRNRVGFPKMPHQRPVPHYLEKNSLLTNDRRLVFLSQPMTSRRLPTDLPFGCLAMSKQPPSNVQAMCQATSQAMSRRRRRRSCQVDKLLNCWVVGHSLSVLLRRLPAEALSSAEGAKAGLPVSSLWSVSSQYTARV